jgi:hypothetical protein
MRTAHLIILLFLLAAISSFFAIEGFAQFRTYREYLNSKFGTSSLCDPCYDPHCKTRYTSGSQEQCPPSSPRAMGLFEGISGSFDGNSGSEIHMLMRDMPHYHYDAPSSNDIIKGLKPEIQAIIQASVKGECAPKEEVTAGSAGRLSLEKLPSPALPPSHSTSCSPATSQGNDYSNGCKPFNMDEYIRKDSIPCYGCTLPA